jgi:pyruvate ferredoxin oxidoreductase alpha subunit
VKLIELKNNAAVAAKRKAGPVALGRAVQAATKGQVAFTWKGVRVGDLEDKEIPAKSAKQVADVMGKVIDRPLRPGRYAIETLLKLAKGKGDLVDKLYASDLQFVSEDSLTAIEERSLKVYLLGSAGTGVVSAVQDMVSAFTSAGYYGRAFPQFDPSKKGAPVRGFGIVSRDPIRSHAPFEAPDIIILFDQKMFPLLRETLPTFKQVDPAGMAILVNTPLSPEEFRNAADFRAANPLYTIDADALVRGKRIPPNYAMIGALLGILGGKAVDRAAFIEVVTGALTAKFGGDKSKVGPNLNAFTKAIETCRGELKEPFRSAALGKVKPHKLPAKQHFMFEDGNRAISRAVASVLNQFPSVVAAYPITPQTQVVEYLAQMIADGDVTAESVTPESEHGAAGAVLGAARDRVLCFTATCSQGFALMSEVIHSIAGMRMGNVVISNVLRSLNSPLDVENDHSDLFKIGYDAGFVVFMTRDVQQAYDFHLFAYLVSLYAEYKDLGDERMEMIPSRSIMLPAIVASEGFEVSHAPEGYLLIDDSEIQKFYADPAFGYVRRFVETPNYSIMGTLQLSNARLDTDFQRHQAMQLVLDVVPTVLEKFAKLSGRKYELITAFNPEADDLFLVAGAANGTFEEVARELGRQGQSVGVLHPNLLRPFPKKEWAKMIEGKRVYVYDRDDPYGAVGGRLYTELAGVINEYQLQGTRLYSRIYGLGGRTPTLSQVRDEILKALRADEIAPEAAKQYVGVNL